MRKQITFIMTAAACALTAYALWDTDASHDEDEDHDHHHHHHHHDGHDHHHHEHEDEVIAISQEQMRTHKIALEIAKPGLLEQSIKTPAYIAVCKDQVAHLYPQVTGTVVEVYKNLGQSVEPNEILATIASREMAEAKAEYLAAYNRSQLTESNFQREKELHERKISATQEFHLSENARQESLIELELARQKLHALGLSEQEIRQLAQATPQSLRMYEMRSPIAGKIIERDVTAGEFVTIDHEAFIVANLDKLWVEITIFPQDRQYVKEGQALLITTHSGQTAHTSIAYLSPIIDDATRTSTAIAELDNRLQQWFPGTFVNAKLITSVSEASLVIPKEAVQTIEGKEVVFIPNEEGFETRGVVIGQSDATHCEIIEGLSLGEPYACTNTFLLKAHLQKDEAEHSH